MDKGKGVTTTSNNRLNNKPTTSSIHQSFQLPAWSKCPNIQGVNGSKVPALYLDVWFKTQSQLNPSLCETSKLYPILISSGLQTELLAAIWTFVNRSIPGQLTVEELFLALALIALAQQRNSPFAFTDVFSLSHPPVPTLSLLPSSQAHIHNENNNHLISIKENTAKRSENDDDEFTDFTFCSISDSSSTTNNITSPIKRLDQDNLIDKYQAFRELQVDSCESNTANITKLCLTACKNLLQKSFNTLIVNHGEECALEALRHPRGKQFIQDLTYVHLISLRTSKNCDSNDLQMESMEDDISRLWTSLTNLFKRADHSFEYPTQLCPENGTLSCRICYWKDTQVVLIKGKPYHQECANLWLNCVNSSLPV